MIIDRGFDFPPEIQQKLDSYGEDMWLYRDDSTRGTTRALNKYTGDFRGYIYFLIAESDISHAFHSFEYLTSRVRITPMDLVDTKLDPAKTLHFICSPKRAAVIMSEVQQLDGWGSTTIYEPIPVSFLLVWLQFHMDHNCEARIHAFLKN